MVTLAREAGARTKSGDRSHLELLLFRLGGPERYGINVGKVREVMKLPALTRMPEVDPRIAGMANLRGAMVPVLNLMEVFPDGPSDAADAAAPGPPAGIVIIVESDLGPHGLLVAGVDRILRVAASRVQAPPALLRNAAHGVVTAVAVLEDGGMVLILDVGKVLDA